MALNLSEPIIHVSFDIWLSLSSCANIFSRDDVNSAFLSVVQIDVPRGLKPQLKAIGIEYSQQGNNVNMNQVSYSDDIITPNTNKITQIIEYSVRYSLQGETAKLVPQFIQKSYISSLQVFLYGGLITKLLQKTNKIQFLNCFVDTTITTSQVVVGDPVTTTTKHNNKQLPTYAIVLIVIFCVALCSCICGKYVLNCHDENTKFNKVHISPRNSTTTNEVTRFETRDTIASDFKLGMPPVKHRYAVDEEVCVLMLLLLIIAD